MSPGGDYPDAVVRTPDGGAAADTASGADRSEDARPADTSVVADTTVADTGVADTGAPRDTGPPDAGCPPATCQMFAGHYAGTYRIYTDERLGSSIINMMECVGTSSIDIDLQADAGSVVRGMLSCTYSGGLTLFDGRQTATFEATALQPNGAISGRIRHRFDPITSSLDRTFNFTGTIDAAGALTISGTGSWLPNTASVVAWGVEIMVAASR
jgi:hypothetical protein